jgi:regulatory protein
LKVTASKSPGYARGEEAPRPKAGQAKPGLRRPPGLRPGGAKKSKPLIEEAQAFRYALWLLNRRPHSRGELVEKFRRRSLPPEMAEKVLEKLRLKGFVKDEAFAESFAHSKLRQGWGPGKIKAALSFKKISRETAEKTLKNLLPERGEEEKALELMRRQKPRFLAKKEKKRGDRARRAFEFLARKGYSFQAARLAVKEVFGYNSGLPDKDLETMIDADEG